MRPAKTNKTRQSKTNHHHDFNVNSQSTDSCRSRSQLKKSFDKFMLRSRWIDCVKWQPAISCSDLTSLTRFQRQGPCIKLMKDVSRFLDSRIELFSNLFSKKVQVVYSSLLRVTVISTAESSLFGRMYLIHSSIKSGCLLKLQSLA